MPDSLDKPKYLDAAAMTPRRALALLVLLAEWELEQPSVLPAPPEWLAELRHAARVARRDVLPLFGE